MNLNAAKHPADLSGRRFSSEDFALVADVLTRERVYAVLRSHGANAFRASKDVAAAHEAGHVTLELATAHYPPVSASIKCERTPRGISLGRLPTTTWTGFTTFGGSTRERIAATGAAVQRNPLNILRGVASLLSGHVGESIFGAGNPLAGSSLDEICKAELHCLVIKAQYALPHSTRSLFSSVRILTRSILERNTSVALQIKNDIRDHRHITAEKILSYQSSVLRVEFAVELQHLLNSR